MEIGENRLTDVGIGRINLQALVVAYAATFLLSTLVVLIVFFSSGRSFLPANSIPPEDAVGLFEAVRITTSFRITSLVIDLAAAVFAGFIVARKAVAAPCVNAALLGLAMALVNTVWGGHRPLWYNLIYYPLIIPASLVGATFRESKNAPNDATTPPVWQLLLINFPGSLLLVNGCISIGAFFLMLISNGPAVSANMVIGALIAIAVGFPMTMNGLERRGTYLETLTSGRMWRVAQGNDATIQFDFFTLGTVIVSVAMSADIALVLSRQLIIDQSVQGRLADIGLLGGLMLLTALTGLMNAFGISKVVINEEGVLQEKRFFGRTVLNRWSRSEIVAAEKVKNKLGEDGIRVGLKLRYGRATLTPRLTDAQADQVMRMLGGDTVGPGGTLPVGTPTASSKEEGSQAASIATAVITSIFVFFSAVNISPAPMAIALAEVCLGIASMFIAAKMILTGRSVVRDSPFGVAIWATVFIFIGAAAVFYGVDGVRQIHLDRVAEEQAETPSPPGQLSPCGAQPRARATLEKSAASDTTVARNAILIQTSAALPCRDLRPAPKIVK